MQKKLARYLFIPFMLLALHGCAIYGPVYKKPKVNKLKQWKSQDNLSRKSHKNLPMMAWWKRFDDKQLNYLIAKALANNNEIQVAVGNAMAAKGELLQIQLSLIPSISALLISYANINVNIFAPGYSSGFLPNYILNLFQYIRSTEWAKAKLAVANAAKDAVRLAVISQTAGGYFAYAGQSLLLEQQKQLAADLKVLLKLSQEQYKRGLISLYQLQAYEQKYEKANAIVPIIANNVVAARNTLKVLLNENPGAVSLGKRFMQLKSQGVIPTNLPAQVLRNRPDVREAEQRLIASNADVGVVTSTFFPSFSLMGLGATGGSRNLNAFVTTKRNYWHELSTLTVPVIYPEFIGQYKSAKGAFYAAFRHYIQVIRVAFKSVDTDLSAHQQYYNSLIAQQKNFSSSDKAYRLAKASYHNGLYSYPTLLLNKINMDHAAIDLTKAKIAQLNTIVQLYEDLGGGYQYKERARK